MNDPYEVKKIIQRTPEAAYESLYKQVEQAYSDNKKINEGKVRNFQCLLFWATGTIRSTSHQEGTISSAWETCRSPPDKGDSVEHPAVQISLSAQPPKAVAL